MHARVTHVRVRPDRVEEAVGIMRDSVLPAAEELRGFGGMILLTDPETGRGINISMWETPEDLEASESGGWYREQIGKFASVLAEQPQREAYEVSVQA